MLREPGINEMIAADEEKTAADLLVELTMKLIAAYVSKNAIRPIDLPALIAEVHSALEKLPPSHPKMNVTTATQEPAVKAKNSVMPDYIICLEDGKKFKSLRRHLMSEHALTPEQYRIKWDLDPTYSMVAPNYSAVRSRLAKTTKFGRK